MCLFQESLFFDHHYPVDPEVVGRSIVVDICTDRTRAEKSVVSPNAAVTFSNCPLPLLL